MTIPFGFINGYLWEVVKPEDVNEYSCFAIQIFSIMTIHHEGDERSRTNPGHGYPAYSETLQTTRTFHTRSRSTWESKLRILFQQDPGRKDVVAFSMQKANIDTSIQVGIEIAPRTDVE